MSQLRPVSPGRRSLLGIVLAVGGLVAACEPGRSFLLKFSGPTGPNDPEVARVARVDLEIFDGTACTCAEIGVKAGCMTEDRVGTLAFTADSGQRTAGGFPEGPLVLRVSAYDDAATQIPLKIDCWCVGGSGALGSVALTLPIGSPRVSTGAGCAM